MKDGRHNGTSNQALCMNVKEKSLSLQEHWYIVLNMECGYEDEFSRLYTQPSPPLGRATLILGAGFIALFLDFGSVIDATRSCSIVLAGVLSWDHGWKRPGNHPWNRRREVNGEILYRQLRVSCQAIQKKSGRTIGRACAIMEWTWGWMFTRAWGKPKQCSAPYQPWLR